MTREEIIEGLKRGRRLCQEEWAVRDTIKIVDQLVAEGLAEATPWEYRDGFQCERRYVVASAAIRAATKEASHGG